MGTKEGKKKNFLLRSNHLREGGKKRRLGSLMLLISARKKSCFAPNRQFFELKRVHALSNHHRTTPRKHHHRTTHAPPTHHAPRTHAPPTTHAQRTHHALHAPRTTPRTHHATRTHHAPRSTLGPTEKGSLLSASGAYLAILSFSLIYIYI